jgi:hypothetical protein
MQALILLTQRTKFVESFNTFKTRTNCGFLNDSCLQRVASLNLWVLAQLAFSTGQAVAHPLHFRACGDLRLSFPYTRLMSRYDRPSHRVYMSFFFKSGWQVQFLETDLKTALPRKLMFSDPEKIKELAKRCEAWATSEARQMLELAIEQGRGGLYLKLTTKQYSKLRQVGRTN